jgi:hypothetical protein
MNTLEIAEHLQVVLQKPSFLNGTLASAEVPYFICPYNPNEHAQIAELPPRLTTYLGRRNIRSFSCDLFAMCIDIFRNEHVWDDIVAQETDLPKKDLTSTLTNLLGNGAKIVEAINHTLDTNSYDIILLHNIGACFPFLRAHAVLNHLYDLKQRIPVLMFFPGTYAKNSSDAMALKLFGTLQDNHYYRALNILTIK